MRRLFDVHGHQFETRCLSGRRMEIDGVPQLPPREAKDRIDGGAALLDVRGDDEVAAAAVPGALHIPLHALRERVQEVPDDRTVVVICHSGGRSHAAAGYLRSRGIDAQNLAGGIVAWHRNGFPVVMGG